MKDENIIAGFLLWFKRGMKQTIAGFFLFLLGLFFFLSLSSCNNYSPAPPDKGNSIFLPLILKEEISFNPLKQRNNVMDFLFDRLLETDGEGNIVPCLVRKWTLSDDEVTWTLELGEDLFWSDGEKISSDDVLFTINYLKDPALSPSFYRSFEIIDKVKKLDDLTVEVKLKEKFAPFPVLLYGIYAVPEHIVKKDSHNPSFFLPGSGPFIFAGTLKDGSFLLFRNDKYRNKNALPEIENIVFRIYKDRESAFDGLIQGNIDFLDDMSVENFTEIEENYSEFNLYDCPGSNYTCMGFNFKEEIFNDPLVRQAISYGVDRELILGKLMKNRGEISTGPIYPFMKIWHEKTNGYVYNPEKSKELLRKGGWKIGDKGVFEKDGKYLYFKLSTYRGSPLRERTVTLIKEFLAEISIAVETEFMEWDEFVYSLYSGKLSAWCVSLTGKGLDPDNLTYYYFYSGLTPEKGGNNYGFYSNEKADGLLLKARKEEDIDRRIEYYRQLQYLFSEDLPVIFLYYQSNLIAINKRIEIPAGSEPGVIRLYGEFYRWKVSGKTASE